MKKDESLPLIYEKNTVSSNYKIFEPHNESLYTNESSINFANLKRTMKLTKMRKSNSTQDLFLTQKSSMPNSQSTSFIFNGKYSLDRNNDYEKNKNILLNEQAIYKLDYLKRFKQIKINLYKKRFFNNNKYDLQKKDENEIFNEDNKNEENNEEEENNKNKVDFSQNIWGAEINLKNHENYDLGDDDLVQEEEIITDSVNMNMQESNDMEVNKETSEVNSNANSNRMSLYLTEMQSINNNNANNEVPFNTLFQGKTNKNVNKKNFGLKKIKIVGKKEKNPFNFTRYASLDNIGRFHKLYRDFKSLCRKHYINEKSASFAFIKACDKERVVCNPLGLLKRKGDENTLEMNNQHSGDRFINCLSTGLKYTNNLSNLEISNNRLTHTGIEKLFMNIKQNESFVRNIIKLNLSNNNIGESGIQKLSNFIEDKNCQLEHLNIEGNNLGDNNINYICDTIALYIRNKITYLNLGKNKITKNSEKGLLAITEKCSELVVLILRNNQINNSLGTKLMINLNKVYSLKMLDISWNLIGDHLVYPFLYEEAVNFFPKQNNLYNNFELDKIKINMRLNFNRNPLLPALDKNAQAKSKSKDKSKIDEIIPEIKSVKVPKRKPSNFAIEFSNYVKSNLCPLVHLNISYNNLSYEDCQLISEESKTNRGILGMHVEGNEMKIDPLGFIHPIQKEQKSRNYYSKTQISYDYENLKDMPKLLLSPINMIRGRSNCWICECWKEVEFILDLKIKDIKPKYTVVKIHFDFENFEPCDMIYKKKCFKLIRMCPPGKITFFYTVDGNPV